MENASKTHWHEVPLPPLEGEVPNGREAQGSQGGFAAGGAKNIRAAFRLAFCQSHQFQQGGADLLFLHHEL